MGLLGDPKDKVFLIIIPEAADTPQLLNSRGFFKTCNSRVHPERKMAAVGTTLA